MIANVCYSLTRSTAYALGLNTNPTTAQQWRSILDVFSTLLQPSLLWANRFWVAEVPAACSRTLQQCRWEATCSIDPASSGQAGVFRHTTENCSTLIDFLLFEDPRKRTCAPPVTVFESSKCRRKNQKKNKNKNNCQWKVLEFGKQLRLQPFLFLNIYLFLLTEGTRSRMSRLTDVLIPTEKLEFSAPMEI